MQFKDAKIFLILYVRRLTKQAFRLLPVCLTLFYHKTVFFNYVLRSMHACQSVVRGVERVERVEMFKNNKGENTIK